MQEQQSEAMKAYSDLERAKRELEVEINTLRAHLEESEAAVETEENKILRTQMELNQCKNEFDIRLREKEEDIESAKRNAARNIDQLQNSLDVESKARSEAIRSKKKLEGEMADLEIQLAHSNRQKIEFQVNSEC